MFVVFTLSFIRALLADVRELGAGEIAGIVVGKKCCDLVSSAYH